MKATNSKDRERGVRDVMVRAHDKSMRESINLILLAGAAIGTTRPRSAVITPLIQKACFFAENRNR